MENYYVVKKGNRTGIFKTWSECKLAVEGYSSPIFRKFTSYNEASEFFKSEIVESKFSSQNSKPFTSNKNNEGKDTTQSKDSKKTEATSPPADMDKIQKLTLNIKSSQYSDDLNYNVSGWNVIDNEIYIFTDGSSRKSKDYFNSGIGVYIGYQCTNIKEQYNNKTNNQCELMAMDYAFKLIVRYYRELSQMNKVVKIVSDSEYSIKSCSVWLKGWKTNNWKTAKGEDVKNKELIESIDGSMMRIKVINSKLEGDNKIKVKLIHVNSHKPCPDSNDKLAFNIWFGNYVADGLAQNIM
jgi:ribonuclease HI